MGKVKEWDCRYLGGSSRDGDWCAVRSSDNTLWFQIDLVLLTKAIGTQKEVLTIDVSKTKSVWMLRARDVIVLEPKLRPMIELLGVSENASL